MDSSLLERKAKLHALIKNAKAAILDFDGLLADSEPYHYKAYNEVFQRYGHTLDKDEYWIEWTSKGKGIAGEIERHNLNLNIDPIELRRQKFEVYSRFCQSGDIKLFPEAIRLVKRLSENYKIAIASGSWAKDIQQILKNGNAFEATYRAWFPSAVFPFGVYTVVRTPLPVRTLSLSNSPTTKASMYVDIFGVGSYL